MPESAIDRIQRMECCFDILLETVNTRPSARQEASFRVLLKSLTDYYEGGQWLQDYTLDEQGLLPPDLKRGVLSQDAVYDFLCRIHGDEAL